MSPSDLEPYIFGENKAPLRVTLASGDQVIINDPSRCLMDGYALYVGESVKGREHLSHKVKHISMPNIVMIERIDPKSLHFRGRGRR
jgi:hypothetical protein